MKSSAMKYSSSLVTRRKNILWLHILVSFVWSCKIGCKIALFISKGSTLSCVFTFREGCSACVCFPAWPQCKINITTFIFACTATDKFRMCIQRCTQITHGIYNNSWSLCKVYIVMLLHSARDCINFKEKVTAFLKMDTWLTSRQLKLWWHIT
jgi:hypothetical protein